MWSCTGRKENYVLQKVVLVAAAKLGSNLGIWRANDIDNEWDSGIIENEWDGGILSLCDRTGASTSTCYKKVRAAA